MDKCSTMSCCNGIGYFFIYIFILIYKRVPILPPIVVGYPLGRQVSHSTQWLEGITIQVSIRLTPLTVSVFTLSLAA